MVKVTISWNRKVLRVTMTSDVLPPLVEVGASCSMALAGQVSTSYPRPSGGSSDITFQALSRFSFVLSRRLPSSRMLIAALTSLS